MARHGRDLRYCELWRSWLIWDGGRWMRDEMLGVKRLAEETLIALISQADPVRDAELVKFAQRSRSARGLNGMVEVAKHRAETAVHPSLFDQEPWLLACPNGTLDLTTGELRDARREDLLTRRTGAPYTSDARSHAWEQLLDAATDGDPEMGRFLQKAVGYTLTGSTVEEKLLFVWGPTSSGKSTFLEAVKAALGEYALTAHFSTFLEQRQAGEAKGDVARMAGARMICSIEVDEGKKLAEGLIKQLTGGDKITARFLYEKQFEFMLSAKLWLAANHKPKVSDEDDALWRRILLVPFDKTIKNPDPAIKAELLDVEKSGAAILAWAVAGCALWREDKLGAPAKVDLATKQYRAEQDPIIDWFEADCEEATGEEVLCAALYKRYQDWCKVSGLRFPLTRKTLMHRLGGRGFPAGGTDRKPTRIGLRLRPISAAY